MIERIKESLARQEKGLELLGQLLREEYSHLLNRNPQQVGGVEFSIQELLRQLAVEREGLGACVRVLGGQDARLSGLIESMSPLVAQTFRALLERIERSEQACAVQAGMNAETAIGLAEQNRDLVTFLQAEILPKSESTYSRNGRWQKESAAPAVVRGRF
jgi:hypothetical protein